MARPGEGVPQTAEEAKLAGWTWLSIKCLSCRHNASVRFDEIMATRPRQKLGFVSRRFYCSKCRSKELSFELGAYVVEHGQPWPQTAPIAFDYNTTIRPPR